MSATPGAPFEQRLWTTLNSPSVEAITEFAVDTNGFKAEFGHAGGGAVSFVSRLGSNKWHAKGFEFYRDDDRTIWGTPDSTINSANFGKVTSQGNAPRQMQLGVRLEF